MILKHFGPISNVFCYAIEMKILAQTLQDSLKILTPKKDFYGFKLDLNVEYYLFKIMFIINLRFIR